MENLSLATTYVVGEIESSHREENPDGDYGLYLQVKLCSSFKTIILLLTMSAQEVNDFLTYIYPFRCTICYVSDHIIGIN